MSRWATSSERARAALRGALLALPLVALLPQEPAGATQPPAPAVAAQRVFLTVEEALELAFGEREVRQDTVFLTKAQVARVEALSGVALDSAIVRPYVALDEDGGVLATAYVDAHRVRTLREALFVVVDREQRVQRLELLSFGEPEEYVPRAVWYGQFPGRRLDDELRLDRGIRGISGATLSARATVGAVRRVLALHQVLAEGEGAAPRRP